MMREPMGSNWAVKWSLHFCCFTCAQGPGWNALGVSNTPEAVLQTMILMDNLDSKAFLYCC